MPRRRLLALGVAAIAVAAGAAQRIHAARALPPDFDEMVYLPLAYEYAARLPERIEEIPGFPENREHPPMVKLVYGAAVDLADPAEPDWETLRVGKPIPDAARPAFASGRWPNVVAGTLQLALVSFASPLAGALLAIEPYHAKYTSQAMLEAIPGVFAILAVLLAGAALRRRRLVLLAAAAACVGAAAAGKYPYGIVLGLTLLPFVVAGFPRRPAVWLGFVAVALAALLALDPTFWPGPLARAREAVAFHWAYAHGDHVVESGLPWHAQVGWLFKAAPLDWHRGVFLTGVVARALLPLAAIGFPVAWRERRIFAVWALVGMVFLLLWPTKWPQYLLMVLPALAVCAACAPAAIAALAARVRRRRPA
jgi:hypothetical protein